ncbi:MAG: TVP38/TMEM64 family protein [Rhodospirillales bacterium]
MADPPSSSLPSLKRLWPMAVVLIVGIVVFALGWDDYLSLSALKEHRASLVAWRQAQPFTAAAVFMGLYVLAVMFSLPGAVWFTVVGGFLFGLACGTTMTVIAATIGACAVFLAARYAFADYCRARAGSAFRCMEQGFLAHGLSYLLFLRLIPIFPFWLVNLVPPLVGMRLRTFFLGTIIGILPGSFVYTLVGHGIGSVLDAGGEPDLGIIFRPQVLAPLVGLALLSLLPVFIKRRRGNQTDEP